MEKKKVLFINQTITPYLPSTEISVRGRDIPVGIQEMKNEIRTFLPKWGNINERRYQLHEVIRLSGMNIIVNDADHPLLIKVASIPSLHLQVYFIDNEDFFQKRLEVASPAGAEYKDNYERAIFYARSVLETLRKLKWYPDVIFCQGWISSFAPFYIKTAYREDPPLAETKVIYSLSDIPLTTPMPDNMSNLLALRHVTSEDVENYKLELKTPVDMARFAIAFSDGVVPEIPNVSAELLDFARSRNIPVMDYVSENLPKAYSDFCDSL